MEPKGQAYTPPYDRSWPAARSASRHPQEPRDRYWLHITLFLLTLVATVYSGGEWAGRLLRYEHLGVWWFVPDGLRFALSLLLFLTVHEFGHYFAARHHRIATSLPYYIPAPPLFTFGTLGAVIRIREPIPSLQKLFDVGAAGPLAGFVVALGVLIYGFATLPPPTYLFDLLGHEEIQRYIEQYGTFPDQMPEMDPSLVGSVPVIGQTLLFWLLSQFAADVPPMYELYHYPFLFAGWLGLFFTALNLLPVGQLDGGHILYSLVGERWHGRIARVFVICLLVSAGVGFMKDMAPELAQYQAWLREGSWFILAALVYFFLNHIFRGVLRFVAPVLVLVMLAIVGIQAVGLAPVIGYSGWFVFLVLIVAFIKVDHPSVLIEEPITPVRRTLGILCMIIFVLCFSIQPIYIR